MLALTTCKGNVVRLNPHHVVYVWDREGTWSSYNIDDDLVQFKEWCTVSIVTGKDFDVPMAGAALQASLEQVMRTMS